MAIIDKINEDLKNCMKTKNEQRLSVIRMLKSKILNVNARGEVSDEEGTKIFKAYAKQLKETIEITTKVGNLAEAKATEQELKIVSEFLPPEISPEEIQAVVTQVVAEIGKDKSKFGQMMKESMNRLKGQADGTVVKDFLNKALSA